MRVIWILDLKSIEEALQYDSRFFNCRLIRTSAEYEIPEVLLYLLIMILQLLFPRNDAWLFYG